LKEYISEVNEVKEHGIEEYWDYHGFKTRIIYDETRDIGKYIEDYKKAVYIIYNFLKKKNYVQFLRKLLFKLDLSLTNWNKGGSYEGNYKEDIIHIIEIKPYVILHEIGHYIYHKVMGPKLIDIWDKFVLEGKKYIGTSVLEEIRNIILSIMKKGYYFELYNEVAKKFGRSYTSAFKQVYEREALKHTLKFVDKNSDSFIILNTILKDYKTTYFPDYSKEERDDKEFISSLDFFLEYIKSDILKYPQTSNKVITAYAGKNSDEAFAESFYLYISDTWKKLEIGEDIMYMVKYILEKKF
jgi:hypothetical protein